MTRIADDIPEVLSNRASTDGNSYVAEVDALRALAMLMVVAIHTGIMPFGWMGVWIFYVVSGFAVTTSILQISADRHSRNSILKEFWLRRFSRIVPVYFVFILLNVVFIVILASPEYLKQLPLLLTFLHNFQMAFWNWDAGPPIWVGFSHLWTLSTEQQFYLVFSLLFVLLSPGRFTVALWIMVAVAPAIRYGMGVAAQAHGFDDLGTAFLIYALAPGHLDAFAAGALIAVHRTTVAGRPSIATGALAALLAVGMIHCTVYAIIGVQRTGSFSPDALRNIVSGILYGQGREISVYWIPILAGITVISGVLSRRPVWLFFCRLPGIQSIGRVSYAGYLVHVPVISVVIAALPIQFDTIPERCLLFISVTTITVLVANLSWRFVERPAIDWLRSVGGSRKTTATGLLTDAKGS
jgi:peptidoglycan/LPS O-acetylase OafA/YrhL